MSYDIYYVNNDRDNLRKTWFIISLRMASLRHLIYINCYVGVKRLKNALFRVCRLFEGHGQWLKLDTDTIGNEFFIRTLGPQVLN